jgi:hypothetical protein
VREHHDPVQQLVEAGCLGQPSGDRGHRLELCLVRAVVAGIGHRSSRQRCRRECAPVCHPAARGERPSWAATPPVPWRPLESPCSAPRSTGRTWWRTVEEHEARTSRDVAPRGPCAREPHGEEPPSKGTTWAGTSASSDRRSGHRPRGGAERAHIASRRRARPRCLGATRRPALRCEHAIGLATEPLRQWLTGGPRARRGDRDIDRAFGAVMRAPPPTTAGQPPPASSHPPLPAGQSSRRLRPLGPRARSRTGRPRDTHLTRIAAGGPGHGGASPPGADRPGAGAWSPEPPTRGRRGCCCGLATLRVARAADPSVRPATSLPVRTLFRTPPERPRATGVGEAAGARQPTWTPDGLVHPTSCSAPLLPELDAGGATRPAAICGR